MSHALNLQNKNSCYQINFLTFKQFDAKTSESIWDFS